MTMDKLPKHYRYSDAIHEDGFYLHLHTLFAIRETNCFYFCLTDFDYNLHRMGQDRSKYARRISKGGVVRYAYPTKKDALHHYKMRKQSQLRRAKDTLLRSSYAIKKLENVINIETVKSYGQDLVKLGKPEFINNYVFD